MKWLKSKFDEDPKVKNLEMNDEVYKLRRKVMDIIYDAKKMASLPRITVRITEEDDNNDIIGLARMKDNIIWISQDAIEEPKIDLRRTVYHEILHAVFGVPHKEEGVLMGPYTDIGRNYNRQELDKLFKKYVEEYK